VIPLDELIPELVLAVGGALFAANLWVLLRPVLQRPKDGRPVPRPTSMPRVYVGLAIGAVATIWSVATLVTRG
jgi:hypothetical protein